MKRRRKYKTDDTSAGEKSDRLEIKFPIYTAVKDFFHDNHSLKEVVNCRRQCKSDSQHARKERHRNRINHISVKDFFLVFHVNLSFELRELIYP